MLRPSPPPMLGTLALLLAVACSPADRPEPSQQAASNLHAVIPTAQAQAPLVTRKLIRNVALEIVVESVARARAQAEAHVVRSGGFVQTLDASSFNGERHVQLTLRVAAEKLDTLLDALRALGAVQHENQNVDDVTRKYVDVDARVRNMERTEQRLLALLQNGQSPLSDVLAVERELARVREEHEVLTAEMRALQEQIALCTIQLGIREVGVLEPPASVWGPAARLWRDAGSTFVTSLAALIAFVAGALTWLLYALPWVPLPLLIWLGVRRWRVRRAARRIAKSPPS